MDDGLRQNKYSPAMTDSGAWHGRSKAPEAARPRRSTDMPSICTTRSLEEGRTQLQNLVSMPMHMFKPIDSFLCSSGQFGSHACSFAFAIHYCRNREALDVVGAPPGLSTNSLASRAQSSPAVTARRIIYQWLGLGWSGCHTLLVLVAHSPMHPERQAVQDARIVQ